MTAGTPAVTDFGQFSRLRAGARAEDPESLRAAAKQFEALMLQQMLKSMRAASPGDDLMGGEQGDFYRDLHDQQLAMHLSSGKGLGIADLLIRQMQQASDGPQALSGPASGKVAIAENAEDFVQQIQPHAEKAAKALGIPARTLIAQAALETGWGQKLIQKADGSPALNFFGIKADKDWQGERASARTHEYEHGQMRGETASFRAYGSIAEGFEDYVRFLQANPRYREALAHGGDDARFTAGLQKAGYATDPGYAAKIQHIASRLSGA